MPLRYTLPRSWWAEVGPGALTTFMPLTSKVVPSSWAIVNGFGEVTDILPTNSQMVGSIKCVGTVSTRLFSVKVVEASHAATVGWGGGRRQHAKIHSRRRECHVSVSRCACSGAIVTRALSQARYSSASGAASDCLGRHPAVGGNKVGSCVNSGEGKDRCRYRT